MTDGTLLTPLSIVMAFIGVIEATLAFRVTAQNKIVNLADYKACKESDDLYEAVLDFAESLGGISISAIQKQFTIAIPVQKR